MLEPSASSTFLCTWKWHPYTSLQCVLRAGFWNQKDQVWRPSLSLASCVTLYKTPLNLLGLHFYICKTGAWPGLWQRFHETVSTTFNPQAGPVQVPLCDKSSKRTCRVAQEQAPWKPGPLLSVSITLHFRFVAFLNAGALFVLDSIKFPSLWMKFLSITMSLD